MNIMNHYNIKIIHEKFGEIHVPHKYLVESLITGNSVPYTLTDHIVNKSKIEAPQI